VSHHLKLSVSHHLLSILLFASCCSALRRCETESGIPILSHNFKNYNIDNTYKIMSTSNANSSKRVLLSAGDPSRGGYVAPRSSFFQSTQFDYLYDGTDTVPRESRRKLPRHSFCGHPTYSEQIAYGVSRSHRSSLQLTPIKTCNKSLKDLLGESPSPYRKISKPNLHSTKASAA
jgi:hypothetical protein